MRLYHGKSHDKQVSFYIKICPFTFFKKCKICHCENETLRLVYIGDVLTAIMPATATHDSHYLFVMATLGSAT